MPNPPRTVARLLGTVVIALTFMLVTTGSPASAAARTPAARYAHRAFLATNAQRTAVGLGELSEQRCVRHAANKQATAMAAANQMFHQDITRLLSACGLRLVGENVAYGYATGRSVVVDGWMQSVLHKANILNPAFRVMGIGARKGSDGRWYVSQVFGTRA